MAELGAFYHQIVAGVYEKNITLEQAMDEMYAHGITQTDINSDYLCAEEPEAFAARLKAHGLGIASVHGHISCDTSSKKALRASIEEMKRRMLLAKRAGSPRFMIVPQKADTYQEENNDGFVKGIKQLFEELALYGTELGVQATVENYSRRDIPYSSFAEIEDLLKSNPHLRYTYDSGNFVLAGFNELVGARIFADKTVYVHLKDLKPVAESDNDEPLILRDGVYYKSPALNEGIVRNEEAVDYLMSNGYDGVFTIEMDAEGNVFEKTLVSADRYLCRINH